MFSQPANYDVIIAGGGPAGSSAAIHLANHGVRVLLLEQKRFPRPKLCGEFISPECIEHFERLGVAHDMHASHPANITETVFYSRAGKKIVVPSGWFGRTAAMGLSRAAMDDNLLKRARSVGADVREETTVVDVIEEDDRVIGVKFKNSQGEQEELASIVIDATGRGRLLTRKLKNSQDRHAQRSKLVAFKAHLTNTRGSLSSCEIYSYPGGYGGLNTIEDGLSNICFIVNASLVKQAHSSPEQVLQNQLMQNQRAAFVLQQAKVATDWLSVSLESFGRQHPSPAKGLLAIGDSAAFIDPFTGSGMLMALESGQLVSGVIVRRLNKSDLAVLCGEYTSQYHQKFAARLRTSGLLRRVAFNPLLAQLTITACGTSERFRNWLVRSTRSRNTADSTPHIPAK
ncbi:MAG TPA: NAD(P)/FAD-dependent oxidoreductase [Pyrinomonadaceae bacterium]